MRLIGTPNIPATQVVERVGPDGTITLEWHPADANLTTITRPALEGLLEQINRLRAAERERDAERPTDATEATP